MIWNQFPCNEYWSQVLLVHVTKDFLPSIPNHLVHPKCKLQVVQIKNIGMYDIIKVCLKILIGGTYNSNEGNKINDGSLCILNVNLEILNIIGMILAVFDIYM